MCLSILQHTTPTHRNTVCCCSVLQCVAVCCSVPIALTHSHVCFNSATHYTLQHHVLLQCIAVCCSVPMALTHSHVCFNFATHYKKTLQHNVLLQCVAVCCSVPMALTHPRVNTTCDTRLKAFTLFVFSIAIASTQNFTVHSGMRCIPFDKTRVSQVALTHELLNSYVSQPYVCCNSHSSL